LGELILTENTEAALTATFKAGKDFDAPWLVVRADNPPQLVAYIESIQQGGLAAILAAAAKDFHGVYQMGHQLGATPAAPVQQAPVQQPVAAPQAAPQQQGGFPQAPQWGGQQQPAQQAPAYQQPVAPPAQAATPAEGPLIPGLGMTAKVKTGFAKTGPKVGQPWTRFEDPRPWAQIKDLAKTKDINDPGIAAGTARYEAYAN
jgi:hypothetical protein